MDGDDERIEELEERRVAVDLVQRIGRGEGAAEAELVSRYGVRLRYFTRRHAHNPALAEEAYQETFTRLLIRLRGKGIREPEKLGRFIYRTSTFVISALLRKEGRQVRIAEEVAVQPENCPASAAEVLDGQRDKERVRELLGDLAVRDRQMLYAWYADMDTRIVAETFDTTEDNVRKVVYRARKRLQKLLEQAGFDP